MNDKTLGPDGPILRRKSSEDSAPAPDKAQAPKAPEVTYRGAAAQPAKTLSAPEPAPPEPVAPRVVIDPSGTTDDFAAMFEASGAMPVRVRYSVGDKVKGTVVAIGPRGVDLELPGQISGVASTEELKEIAVGDVVDLFVVDTRRGISLAKSLAGAGGSIELLEQALASGAPIEGRVTGKNKGGFEIDIKGTKAFCPISQIDSAFVEDMDAYLEKTFQFKVTDIREDGRNIIVSRSALLDEARKARADEILHSLQPGATLSGTVTRLADFGAFVDLGGIEGLVHVSELAFRRLEHPSEAVSVGDTVIVKLKSLEQTDKGLRISLSVKDALEDPWEGGVDAFIEGQRVAGTVVRVEPFGAFVELAPGLEGLVHVSELAWEHVKRTSDIVSVGDKVQVEIQSVDKERRRISLSMKAVAGDPWESIEDRFVPGVIVTGTVENVEDFGVFVDLNGTTALIPRSELDLPKEASAHRKFKRGDDVTARVLTVDKDRRRIALTLRSEEAVAAQHAETNAPRAYQEPSSSFGTLGDLLKARQKK